MNKHTDLISSAGILALTTCLLAAKIFPRMPTFLPRLSLVILNFGGIIWLNVQIRDFVKNVKDQLWAMNEFDISGMLLTSLKVFVRGADLLLTCGMFTAAVVAFCGRPELTLRMYSSMRPFAIASFVSGIFTEIANYFINRTLINKMKAIPLETQKAKCVMNYFFAKIFNDPFPSKEIHEEKTLARHIIRQLDTPTLETFQEMPRSRQDANHFYALQKSLINKQAATEGNLCLITFGYINMGICKIFPGTMVEISLRWLMSVFYTDELIKQKLFQYDLAKEIVKC